MHDGMLLFEEAENNRTFYSRILSMSSESSFPSVVEAFQTWMEDLETEQQIKETIKERVKDLEASGRELAAILQKIHHACVRYGASDDQGVVDYINGANIAGFVKVADAMLAQGVV